MTPRLACLLACATLATGLAGAQGPQPARTAVTFNGTEFVHRLSKEGRHEFTPRGQDDLSTCPDRLAVQGHDSVRTAGDLAKLATSEVGRYQHGGQVLWADSRPKTAQGEAEHFAAARFASSGGWEVVYLRYLLQGGRGVVVTYSRRVFGPQAEAELETWLKQNEVALKIAWMSWGGVPSLASLPPAS